MVLLWGGRKRRTQIGLDIGAYGVRVVQLVRTGTPGTPRSAGYTLGVSASSERIPASSRDVFDASGTPDWGRRLKLCLLSGEFQGRRVRAMLNPPAVEFHALDLPSVVLNARRSSGESGPSDVGQVVRWEVARLRNEPVEAGQNGAAEVETRYWVLPPTQAPAPNVIGAAARREAVDRIIGTCAGAGMLCTCIDAGAAALARLGVILKTWSTSEIWGVLDLAHTETRLVLCVEEVPVLVRRVGSGGCAWTERIAQSLQLRSKNAEIHKREHGLAPVRPGRPDAGRGVRRGESRLAERTSRTPGKEVAAILSAALRTELKDLASQIKRSYEYALSCYPDRHAADLILVGGGAKMLNLPEYLSDALGIPVHRAGDYLEGSSCRLSLRTGRKEGLETLASAVGVAIEHR